MLQIGGLDLVIVLDCDEEFAKKTASSAEVTEYRQQTLGVLGYYDNRNRLEVVGLPCSYLTL